ncbi:MAG: WD40 repeat domain-containing protein [Bacteroidales bacterium]|nr:WD40 repeat domain-containing protein [Bacteroidales bacterium]
MNRKTKSIGCLAVLAGMMVPSGFLCAQGTNMDFEKIMVGDNLHILSGAALAPDNNTLAVSSVQSYPLYLFDLAKREVTGQFDVGNWYAGSRLDYSSSGKYILLQQMCYMDMAPNKDREVMFEIMEPATGRKVLFFDKYHSVVITPDEQYALALTGDEVSFWNLSTGQKESTFTVPEATNSIAVSPDGRHIALSHKPDADALERDPRYKKDKKGLKAILNYKQQVSIYDAATLQRICTVDEWYDIIYNLRYSDDGAYLFCLNIPHARASTAVGNRQNFVSVVDVNGEYQAMRSVFPSNSSYEPEFRMSPDGKLFGITSLGKSPEIIIYDFAKAQPVSRFELSYRFFESIGKEQFPSDGRVAFDFMPDSRSVIMTFGNMLVLWKIGL